MTSDFSIWFTPFPSNLSARVSRASVFLRRLGSEHLAPPAAAAGGETMFIATHEHRVETPT
jgi:hypothetical protein